MDIQTLALIQTDPGITPDMLNVMLGPIENLLNTTVDVDYMAERVLQLLRLEKADAYDRGIQNIAPSLDDNGVVRFTAFGVNAGTTGNQDTGLRALDYNPRKTRSYRDKFVSVLGQRPFYNTTAEPNDPTSDTDRRAARQVNLLLQMLHNQWNMRGINNRLFYYCFKHGTVLGHVRPVTDAKKFGTHQVPKIVPQQQCMDCGSQQPLPSDNPTQANPTPGPAPCAACGSLNTPVIPTQQGFNNYPNTSVEPTLLNGYFWTTPFNVQELKDTPWLRLEAEKNKGRLMRAWPNSRTLVGPTAGGAIGGSAANATGAVVRAASQSQMGIVRSQRANLWTDQRTWLSPDQYELIDDETARNMVKQVFPRGLKVVRLEDKTVALHGEDLNDVFNSCLPAMSDYLFCDGISWGIFGMDDYWSNLLNIAADTLESGIARYILNPDFFNADAMGELRYSPTRFVEALPKTGEGFSNAFAILPTADFPAQLNDFMGIVDDVIQQVTGMLPQVFGQMPAGLTLGQARMMLTQGLMQLGTIADNALHFYESLDVNAVNLYLKVATVNPSLNGEQIDLDLIRQGNWTIKSGTVMPRTFAERQQALVELLQQSPQLAASLKVTDPVNFAALTMYLDLPDLKNPDLDAMEAINDIIDQLWQGQPIIQPPQPAPVDPTTGMPSGPPPPPQPPQPSIDFDPLIYDPQMAISLCRAALTSRSGIQRQSTPGYQNVRAFLQAAQQASIPPPPPMPPPKLSLSLALDKTPSEQEMAVLQKYGIDTPFPANPSMNATNRMEEQAHKHQLEPQTPLPLLNGAPAPAPNMPIPPASNPGNPLLNPNPMPTGVM